MRRGLNVTGTAVAVGVLAAAAPAYAAKRTAQNGDPATNQTAPQPDAQGKPQGAPPATPPAPVQHFDIDDFEVQGADTLPQIDLERAIYPFMGPNKTPDDVEKARAALEKAYQDKGFQTVSVSIPQQNVVRGVVILKVAELKVGRLRVKNSHWFDIDRIKDKAPSLKEGTVPNFGDVTKDIVALNQWPDRRVTPALRAGVTPGTVDVDLNVEDKIPVHGSVELNNRQSPNTTPERLVATVHYDDLWQLGHSLSFTYQVAPERPSDAEVFSASYLARIPDLDWLSFLTYAVKSNSNVATVGNTNIVGPGQILGERAVITLPGRDNFFHTLSVGLDYKHFDQTLSQPGSTTAGATPGTTSSFASPVTYYPLVGSYGATFQGDGFNTVFNSTITDNLRQLSDNAVTFDNRRFDASPSFTHFNADVTWTQELPEKFQFWAKVQGQFSNGPLVSSEQMSVGGLDTVRGYLESETLADDGFAGSVEFRSPDLASWMQGQLKDADGKDFAIPVFNEWRFFAFTDYGHASVIDPLPEQQAQFDLWSYGAGARFKVFTYGNAMIALSMPMISLPTINGQNFTHAGDPRINFRIWGEF